MTTEYSTEKVTELLRSDSSESELAMALEAVAADRDKAIDGLFRAVKALGFDTDDAANADEFFGPQTYCTDGARYTEPWDIAVAYAADYRTEMEEEADQIEAERHEVARLSHQYRNEAERLRAVIAEARRMAEAGLYANLRRILSRIPEHDDTTARSKG